ncbi:AMIN domain-containing protein, partial [bacterium]
SSDLKWLAGALLAAWAVPASAARITGVTVGAAGARIALDAPVPYRAFRLSGPDRYVVDLRGAELAVPERSWPGAGDVKGVRAAPFADVPGVTRVVFDLSAPLEAGTRDAVGGLLVEFRAPAEPSALGPADFKDALAPLALPVPALPRAPGAALPRPMARRAAPQTPRLVAVEASAERVDLTLAGPFEPTFFMLPSPPRLVVDLPDVEAAAFPPARVEGGGTVSSARAGGRGGWARVVIDLSRPAPYSVQTGDGALSILFETGPAEPAPSRTREFKGWVVDGSGRPLDGVFLVRFSVPDEGTLDAPRWQESVYVDARGGRFLAVLGRGRALPNAALAPGSPLDAAAPAGVAYRIVPR